MYKFALHASIVSSLVAFLASQWYHTFQSFGNLYFLGLTFFHSKDVFLNGLNSAIISFQYLGQRHLTQQRSPCGFNSRNNKTKINHWIFFKVLLVEYFLEYFKIFHSVDNFQWSKSLAGKNFCSLLKICENHKSFLTVKLLSFTVNAHYNICRCGLPSLCISFDLYDSYWLQIFLLDFCHT